MVARANTVAFQGIEVVAVDVQVQMAAGLPAFTLVGLPDKAVAESRERVRGALHAMGLALPTKRITVNLSPADLPKEGSHYDLPIGDGCRAAPTAEAGSPVRAGAGADHGLEYCARSGGRHEFFRGEQRREWHAGRAEKLDLHLHHTPTYW